MTDDLAYEPAFPDSPEDEAIYQRTKLMMLMDDVRRQIAIVDRAETVARHYRAKVSGG